ncbi:hypothetical protein P692DRAFT_20832177 [Suillus brevipes Sb2]|nr:hypothetical protein P692DRAFT_20832177 [Suillus brevipes Sb2]
MPFYLVIDYLTRSMLNPGCNFHRSADSKLNVNNPRCLQDVRCIYDINALKSQTRRITSLALINHQETNNPSSIVIQGASTLHELLSME